MLLALAHGFDHRRLDPLGERCNRYGVGGIEVHRPGADQHLIEQVFGAAAGHRRAGDLAAVAAIDPQPMRDTAAPFARHLRQLRDAQAAVLAALGIVRRRR